MGVLWAASYQGWANYCLCSSDEYSQAHSFGCCLWLLQRLLQWQLSSCDRGCMAHKAQNTIWPYTQKVCQLLPLLHKGTWSRESASVKIQPTPFLLGGASPHWAYSLLSPLVFQWVDAATWWEGHLFLSQRLFMSLSPPGQGGTISYFAQRGMCVQRLAIVMNISESIPSRQGGFPISKYFWIRKAESSLFISLH